MAREDDVSPCCDRFLNRPANLTRMLSLATVRAARERIAGHVHTTPVMSATRLGDRVGVRLLLKCENFQKTGSFKARGALN